MFCFTYEGYEFLKILHLKKEMKTLTQYIDII